MGLRFNYGQFVQELKTSESLESQQNLTLPPQNLTSFCLQGTSAKLNSRPEIRARASSVSNQRPSSTSSHTHLTQPPSEITCTGESFNLHHSRPRSATVQTPATVDPSSVSAWAVGVQKTCHRNHRNDQAVQQHYDRLSSSYKKFSKKKKKGFNMLGGDKRAHKAMQQPDNYEKCLKDVTNLIHRKKRIVRKIGKSAGLGRLHILMYLHTLHM